VFKTIYEKDKKKMVLLNMASDDFDELKTSGIKRIQSLIEDYEAVIAKGNKDSYNEERVKIAFVVPLLEALGWNPRTDSVLPEQATLTGRADFGLRINGRTKVFVEMKSFAKSLDGHDTVKGRPRLYSEQAIQYAWGMKADWAALTNFEEIRLYDSHVKKPSEGLVWKKPLRFTDYVSRFDELWLLSKRSVSSGMLDSFKAKARRPPVDEAFLDDLADCRQLLARNIKERNRALSDEQLNESVQKILDRLIFIKNCEDRLIIPAESLWKRFRAWQETAIDVDVVTFMMDLKNLFRYFDQVYNGKLFEKHICEDLRISNDALEQIINILYGDSQHLGYNFSVIPIDVLGQAYELYIGSIIKEKQGLASALEIIKEPKKRKKYGIYYTPEAIVSFIIKETVGKFLEGCKEPKDVSAIRILDPACGSGSFLIENVDVIRDWYKAFDDRTSPNTLPRKLDGSLVAHLRESKAEETILTKNLFGVDLDPQAVEITILNLSLKAVAPKQKLPYMGDHVKCGNSIVSSSSSDWQEYFTHPDTMRAFDWNREFVEIIKEGGFKVVVGNPPYVTMESLPEYQNYCKAHYPEVYSGKNDFHYYFLTKGIQLLCEKGLLGFITSRYFIEAKYAKNLRKYILENSCVKAIVDFGNFQVFDGVNVLTSIIILQKNSSAEERQSNTINIVTVKQAKANIADLIVDIDAHIGEVNYSDDQISCFTIRQSELSEDSWELDDEQTKKIKSQMGINSFKLKDVCEIEQSQKSGLNEAFVVSSAYAKEKHLEEELLRRVIKNSDVLKYYIDWKHKFLIYTTDKTRIDDYPNIRKHLEKYKEKLESRAEEEKGQYPWFRLQRPRRQNLYDVSEKIIVPFLATENRFALDNNRFYGLADTYAIVPKQDCPLDTKYILAVLNSKPLEFYHKKTAKLKRGEYYEYFAKPLSKLPIKKIDVDNEESKDQYDRLNNLTESIMTLKKKCYDTLHLFNRILRNVQTSKTEVCSFLEGYYSSGSQYSMDLSLSEKLVDDSVIGEITEISVEEENHSLVFTAKYITKDEEKKNEVTERLIKIHFESESMRQFFYYGTKVFLMKNYRKRNWGEGPVIETVLGAIRIPKFVTNIEINKEKISSLMEEFRKASPSGFSLTKSELEVSKLQENIDSIVVELYGLDKEQSDYINSYIEHQKSLVSKTI